DTTDAQHQHGCDRPPDKRGPLLTLLDHPRQIELRWQRLVGDRGQRLAQEIALVGKGGDASGDVGMACQIGGDFRLSLGFENAIHKGVEIVFHDGPIAHFMLRNCTTFFGEPSAVPSISCCNLSRARDRRDITVPTGISSTLAASAYDRSSTATSSSTARWSSGSCASLSRTSWYISFFSCTASCPKSS